VTLLPIGTDSLEVLEELERFVADVRLIEIDPLEVFKRQQELHLASPNFGGRKSPRVLKLSNGAAVLKFPTPSR
jgi:hypothetical protein